ncbi:acylglycerol [Cystoisospora suis]|uniref:Acylglycerol n=1 Tax=Cystoisospora suis TaxID=483139 RepID=A0A2C6L531_9APIC|nr:acylglycerol [Cystoisospora suis]
METSSVPASPPPEGSSLPPTATPVNGTTAISTPAGPPSNLLSPSISSPAPSPTVDISASEQKAPAATAASVASSSSPHPVPVLSSPSEPPGANLTPSDGLGSSEKSVDQVTTKSHSERHSSASSAPRSSIKKLGSPAALPSDALGNVVEAFAHINRAQPAQPKGSSGEGSGSMNGGVEKNSNENSLHPSSEFQRVTIGASSSLKGQGTGGRGVPAASGALDACKSKKLHLGTSHQNYAGVEEWLEAYQISLADLGPHFRAGKLTNQQGLDLATYSWTHQKRQDVRGAVVLFHSYTSHALWDFMRHQPAHQCVEVSVHRKVSTTSAASHHHEQQQGGAQQSQQETQTELVDMKTWIPLYSGSWVEAFYSQGLNVYALDHQSHGHSAGWNGWRCNVEKFDHFVDDAFLFLKSTVATDPLTPRSSPIYILGYSMGGNITLQTLCRVFNNRDFARELREKDNHDHDYDTLRANSSSQDEGVFTATIQELRDRVKGCVLLAPMLKILLDRKTRCLAKFNRSIISSCMPNLRLARGGTSDEEYAYLDWWYEKDLYAYGGSSKSRMIANLYGATIQIKKMIKTLPPHLRVICLQGTKDMTVDHRAALMLAKSPVQLDLLYLTGWSHYLAKEKGFELLRDLVVAWIHSKLQLDSSPSSPRKKSRGSISSAFTDEMSAVIKEDDEQEKKEGIDIMTQTSFDALPSTPTRGAARGPRDTTEGDACTAPSASCLKPSSDDPTAADDLNQPSGASSSPLKTPGAGEAQGETKTGSGTNRGLLAPALLARWESMGKGGGAVPITTTAAAGTPGGGSIGQKPQQERGLETKSSSSRGGEGRDQGGREEQGGEKSEDHVEEEGGKDLE